MTEKNVLKSLLMLAALLATSAYGSSEITGKVTYAGTYGNGDVYVALDTSINEQSCPQARFDVPKAIAGDILSIAQTAIQQDKYVTVRTKGCYAKIPTLDVSRDSYFYIRN